MHRRLARLSNLRASVLLPRFCPSTHHRALRMRVQTPIPTPPPPPPPPPPPTTTTSMQSTRPLPVVSQMTPSPVVKKPHPRKDWHVPQLLLQVKDVCHPGAAKYFSTTNTETLLRDAVIGVLARLYTYETAPTSQRSITLILRTMDGVAYTTGSDLDPDHKEIHFSLDYIAGIPSERVASEILGVIRHEMVHCWQYNGHNTCPGGLIEGIADWVRLKDGFCPPHWHRGGSRWDDGYQNTAYFLEWLEERFGEGTVMAINGCMRKEKYCEDIWGTLCRGGKVKELWGEYQKVYGIGEPKEPVETCTVRLKGTEEREKP